MIFQNNKSFTPDSFPWKMLTTPAVSDFFIKAPRYLQVTIVFR